MIDFLISQKGHPSGKLSGRFFLFFDREPDGWKWTGHISSDVPVDGMFDGRYLLVSYVVILDPICYDELLILNVTVQSALILLHCVAAILVCTWADLFIW